MRISDCSSDVCSSDLPRFGGKRLAGAQMALVACRSGIVGGEQSGIAEAVIHGAQIGRTRQDIVARIIWIATQTMLPTHFRPGAGHELHQSHLASPAGEDRQSVVKGKSVSVR